MSRRLWISTLYFTNHGGPGGVSTQLRAHGNFTTGFHTLTCIWMPGQLQFFVDGVRQGILTKNVPHQPMFFAIAVESGDAFVGLPDSTTMLPVALEVDWVHLYSCTTKGEPTFSNGLPLAMWEKKTC